MSETGNSKAKLIGRIPQGTRLCQFYQDKEELGETLIHYFEAGLANNDLCILITAEPTESSDTRKSLEHGVKNSQGFFESGQLRILDASDCFPTLGKFDVDRHLAAWKEKIGRAQAEGYTGIRTATDISWFNSQNREAFSQYESLISDIISEYPMTTICCYPADRYTPLQYIEIFKNHRFLLSKENSELKLIENLGRSQEFEERKQLMESLQESEEKYRLMAENVTDVIWTMDMNLNFTYMSPSVFRARGFTAEEAMAISIHEYLPPDSYQAAMEIFAEELENEKNPGTDPFRSRTLEL